VGEMGEGMMGRRLFDLINDGKMKPAIQSAGWSIYHRSFICVDRITLSAI
jgi:hypothetical protein